MVVRTELERAEFRLCAAMLASDVEALEDLVSDRAIFTNHLGQRLSKADDIAAHRSGLLRVERFDFREAPLVHHLDDDTAVVFTTVDLAGRYADDAFSGAFAYSRVWHRTGGRWQVDAAHCSAVAEVDLD